MIRKVKQSDVETIEKILKKIPQFTITEIEIAMEFVNIAVNNKTQTDYNVFVFEQYENVSGLSLHR